MPDKATTVPIQTALISVSDKSGIIPFANSLIELGINILSTGGTASLLRDNGIEVTDVSEHTGFAEIMDGRVKTLHPLIHGGILGRPGQDDNVMAEQGITPIGLVVVNLYPFEKTVAKISCSLEDAIENIDIGGPTMLRAAAKNHAHVAVVVNQEDYQKVVKQMKVQDNRLDPDTRFDLAVKAFEHTAKYDGSIANYLGVKLESDDNSQFPRTWNAQYIKKQSMRYGENPHQNAAFYSATNISNRAQTANLASAEQVQGKALSYNNIADSDAALECIKQFSGEQACVIVKHANPCGVAIGNSQLEAYQRAFNTDPESAFGGIIAFNSELQGNTASAIVEKQFVEVVIAPSITDSAKKVFAKKDNARVLICGQWGDSESSMDFKRVSGGLLVQESDQALYDSLEVVTIQKPSTQQMSDLIFAWKVAKFVKSNAIVYAGGLMTFGVGAGQMSRVNSSRIAAIKAEHAGLSLSGAVMASDAFFPFRDGLDNAAAVGISAVIQPGGSMRDAEVIAAANEHGIAMVFTGMRHFRH